MLHTIVLHLPNHAINITMLKPDWVLGARVWSG
jgi:hypothetical protein